MLIIRELTVAYGTNPALNNIELDVETGKITTVIGSNGAGKTTLLRAISGLLQPRSGTIELDGSVINGWSASEIVKAGISHVPEGRELFPRMKVYDNLLMGGYLRGPSKKLGKSLETVYGHFPVLKEKSNLLARNLSGGEQQMLAFGRALMSSPKYLLLDEPSIGLAPKISELIMTTLRSLADAEDLGVLLVEQNANLALRYSDFGYVFDLGAGVSKGPAQALLDDPAVQHAYLGVGPDFELGSLDN